MPAITDNASFIQPENINGKIWKYYTFDQFLSLITTSKFILSRIDTFDDDFEGQIEEEKVEDTIWNKDPNIRKLIMDAHRDDPRVNPFYINRICNYAMCWCYSDFESAALWKLFGKNNNSLAIQTKYSKLVNILPDTYYIGKIQYDFHSFNWTNPDSLFRTIMTKRESFSFENEIRVISNNRELLIKLVEVDNIHEAIKSIPKHILLKLDFNNLIENIFINPKSDVWFSDLVENICAKYAINVKISKSSMHKDNYHLI